MRKTLTSSQRYSLTRELDVFSKSQRAKTIESSAFAEEMSRELGFPVTVNHVKYAANTIGLSLLDLFCVGSNGRGRSVYIDLYRLTERVDAIEKILDGLK